MAYYIKGNPVANAKSYELLEKKNGTYNSIKEASEINFDVSTLNLAPGEHIFVVKAHASGYESSEYSNEVSYNVSESGGNTGGEPTEPDNPGGDTPSTGTTTTLTANGGSKSYIVKTDGTTMSGGTYGNLEYDLSSDIRGKGTISITFDDYVVPASNQYLNVCIWALFSGTVDESTILTPTGPDIHDGIRNATIDLSLYPTATKLRVAGVRATMATTVVVTHTA